MLSGWVNAEIETAEALEIVVEEEEGTGGGEESEVIMGIGRSTLNFLAGAGTISSSSSLIKSTTSTDGFLAFCCCTGGDETILIAFAVAGPKKNVRKAPKLLLNKIGCLRGSCLGVALGLTVDQSPEGLI